MKPMNQSKITTATYISTSLHRRCCAALRPSSSPSIFLQRSSNNNGDVLFHNVVVDAVAFVVAKSFYVVRLPRTILLHWMFHFMFLTKVNKTLVCFYVEYSVPIISPSPKPEQTLIDSWHTLSNVVIWQVIYNPMVLESFK